MMKLQPKFFMLSIFFLFILTMAGCSSTKSALKMVGLGANNNLSKISVESTRNSNLNTPVAIDILFIYDENVTSILLDLNGPTWFNNKLALVKRYDKEIDIVNLEVVPLSFIDEVNLPKEHKHAKNILMFANYRSRDG